MHLHDLDAPCPQSVDYRLIRAGSSQLPAVNGDPSLNSYGSPHVRTKLLPLQAQFNKHLKDFLHHLEILSPLLAIAGVQNDTFLPIDAGFPRPETALHSVKLRQEQLMY